jgi:hypothetical protein
MVNRQQLEQVLPAATLSHRPLRWRSPALLLAVALLAVGCSSATRTASVTEMYEALNEYDADAYARFWAEDAKGWGPYVWGDMLAAIGSPEMDQGFEERQAWGAQFTVADCELVDEAVRCLETWDDRLHGIAGVTIQREVIYTFDDRAKIAAMRHLNSNRRKSVDFFQAFNLWMSTTYPETAETYLVPGFTDSAKIENWFAPPENVAELTGLIEEFVAQSDDYPLAP